MENKAYTWAETLAVERRGEAILDALFGVEYIIVKATKAHQKQKIDRFHIHRRDGRRIYRVDYKVDEKAGRFNNLALEEVSVRRNGRIQAMGWVHTTIAHYVVSYVPAHDTAYVLEIAALRERWADIQKNAAISPRTGLRLRPVENNDPKYGQYITENYCVPIKWLREEGLIFKEMSAIGAQLRLPLKVTR